MLIYSPRYTLDVILQLGILIYHILLLNELCKWLSINVNRGDTLPVRELLPVHYRAIDH